MPATVDAHPSTAALVPKDAALRFASGETWHRPVAVRLMADPKETAMTRNQRIHRARALSVGLDWRNPLHALAEARLRKARVEVRRGRLIPPHGADKHRRSAQSMRV
jgi:hypothetical protein